MSTTVTEKAREFRAVLDRVEKEAATLADYLENVKKHGVKIGLATAAAPAVVPEPPPPTTATNTPPSTTPLIAIPLDLFKTYEILSPAYKVDSYGNTLVEHMLGTYRESRNIS
jgi:hypothetical protein